MNAMRHIIKSDGAEINFEEKCLCGNTHEINKDDPEYSTCLCCLRVYRVMRFNAPDGTNITIWGIYFDPYFMETLAGRFINAFIEHLPEERYPR